MIPPPPVAETTPDSIQADVEAAIRAALRPASPLVAMPCRAAGSATRALAAVVLVAMTPVRVAGGIAGAALQRLGPQHPAAGATDQRDHGEPPVIRRRTSKRVQAMPADEVAITDDFPIADYEALPTANIVARLERLSAAELAIVAEFEAAHRGRRTVLGRIAQLGNTTT